MQIRLQTLFIILIAAIAAHSAVAVQAPEPTEPPTEKARAAGVFTLYFENDYFGGEDQHYTNGVKLSWTSSDLVTWGQEGWRKTIVEALPFVNREAGQKNLGFAIGQNIYTPQDISLKPPDASDRPYAGWSYLELTFASKTSRIMDSLSFQVGMVGPHSYADDTQTIVHKWINDETPRGWEYQLKDELGVNIVYERKWRLFVRSLSQTWGADFTPHVGASVGNVQTYANAGGTFRLGINLPSDFGTSLIQGSSANSIIDDNDPRVGSSRHWSFLGFAGADGRAVGRDIFLDGNTFKDGPSVDREYLVGDAFYGVGLVLGKWQITYTEVVRTKEFKAQARKSYFGSVTISRVF
jgi:lipid A 3-O-deacylase